MTDEFVVLDAGPDDISEALVGGLALTNVHPAEQCAGRPCVVHAPTDHALRDWPLTWRNDRGIFERRCQHGVGHPDPDQFEFWCSTGQEAQGVHGCCGCCRV